MRPPIEFSRIVDKKKYDVKTATLIAHDAFWDGHNFERQGRNTFLYRTLRGNYFAVYLTRWQGEQDILEPKTQDEAIELYEGNLTEHEVPYGTAFPGVEVEEA